MFHVNERSPGVPALGFLCGPVLSGYRRPATCRYSSQRLYSVLAVIQKGFRMRYVISDIHGCYDEFLRLLEKIHFTEEDDLYILGDVVDRGPKPIELLQDLMMRPNVYPILGNHDYVALTVLERFNIEITEENADSHLTTEDLLSYVNWIQNGGAVTARQFSKLTKEEKQNILDYLREFSVYEEVHAAGKRYVLVHGGIHGFREDRKLNSYDFSDLIFYRADYSKRYYQDRNTFLVTGHTPTLVVREDGLPLVYEQHGHIAVDCGCVFGGRLAAYCLDTGEVHYVDGFKKPS